MTTASVASGFSSPFGLSGSLGYGTASILGGDADNNSPDAATLLSSGQQNDGSPLAALADNAKVSAGKKATIEALGEGKLTNQQHNVISTIGGTKDNSYTINWNRDGSEPTILKTLRSYGWIKLIKPNFSDEKHSVTSGAYALTTIGKAIYKRTGGGPATTASSSVDVSA